MFWGLPENWQGDTTLLSHSLTGFRRDTLSQDPCLCAKLQTGSNYCENVVNAASTFLEGRKAEMNGWFAAVLFPGTDCILVNTCQVLSSIVVKHLIYHSITSEFAGCCPGQHDCNGNRSFMLLRCDFERVAFTFPAKCGNARGPGEIVLPVLVLKTQNVAGACAQKHKKLNMIEARAMVFSRCDSSEQALKTSEHTSSCDVQNIGGAVAIFPCDLAGFLHGCTRGPGL